MSLVLVTYNKATIRLTANCAACINTEAALTIFSYVLSVIKIVYATEHLKYKMFWLTQLLLSANISDKEILTERRDSSHNSYS